MQNYLVRISLQTVLLFIGSFILILLITYSPIEYSLNSISTADANYGLVIKFRNIIADIFIQIFGYYSSLLISFFFIIYSYQIYTNKAITLLKYRIIAFILAVIFSTLNITNLLNYMDGGVLGLFLYQYLKVSNILLFWLLVINIYIYVFSINITFLDIRNTISAIKIMFIKLFNCIIYNNAYYRVIRFFTQKKEAKNRLSPTKLANIDLTPNLSTYEDEYIKGDKIVVEDIQSTENHKIPLSNKSEVLNNINKDVNEADYFNSSLFANPRVNKNLDTIDDDKEINSLTTLTAKDKSAVIQDDDHKKENDIINDLDNHKKYYLPLKFLFYKENKNNINNEKFKQVAVLLEQILKEFSINGKIVGIEAGPVVTLYELAIPAGIKTVKVIALETDLALRLKVSSIRIAVVSGKDVLGIEVPNKVRKLIYLKELFQDKEFMLSKASLPIALGYDIRGNIILEDLATMPHLLIAGTTGSGKSVGINVMILSLLYKLPPEKCKLIMIDPKMLELSIYQDIPHLYTPVVTDAKKAVNVLKWLVKEMENRYYLMSILGVRNINNYNNKILSENTEELQTKINESSKINLKIVYMPYIVVIIDEMADLMMVAGKEVEVSIQRLAQMARAADIHLLMATQRPSVDVITGTIKANFPTRISFQVSSKIDSRTILGEQGAEQLLGKGDMLLMAGVGRFTRIHAPFVSDEEVLKITNYLKQYGKPQYLSIDEDENNISINSSQGDNRDEFYANALDLIHNEGKISTSYLQRKFQIGCNRAARIIEQLEEDGVISKPNASGKREIF